MSQLDVGQYVPGDYLKRQLLSGRVDTLTLSRRVADPGDTFRVGPATFEITQVREGAAAELGVVDVEGDAVVHCFERVASETGRR